RAINHMRFSQMKSRPEAQTILTVLLACAGHTHMCSTARSYMGDLMRFTRFYRWKITNDVVCDLH
ncbi:MAG TPA: hypothetical protein VGK58_07935, partial [Lacipirellulaceae bacterium]